MYEVVDVHDVAAHILGVAGWELNYLRSAEARQTTVS